jgi:hypothetical protein
MRRASLLILVLAAGCVREGNDPPRRNHLVTVATEPGGDVASTPPGISCGPVCTGSFAHGSVVTLEPKAEQGARFAGWSGACSGTRLCILTVNDDLRASAAFELADGSGKVPPDRPMTSDLDKDGVPDDRDRCPVDPGKQEGCPVTDTAPPPPDPTSNERDGDGILDVDDKCPDDPEDMDGFEDADGCPDPDNDMDGILDVDDLCPNDPETRNGHQDADGCPDRR